MKTVDDSDGYGAGGICILQTELIARIQQQQNGRGHASHASNLLGDAILEHHHVGHFQRRIIMAKPIKSY